MARLRKASRPVQPGLNLQTASILPRRFLIVFALACTIALIVVLTLPTSSDTSTLDQLRNSYKQSAKQAKQFFRDNDDLPNLYNPFAQGEEAHRPTDQGGAKHRGISWYEDGQWQKPFSSSVTLDEERIVLPPLAERAPIYTYYDGHGKTHDEIESDEQLLLTWRRAWWAQGFRPMVLGPSQAQKKEKMWQALQSSVTKSEVSTGLKRLLAFSQTGGGILTDSIVFPMAAPSDPLLTRLRDGPAPDEPTKLGSMITGLLHTSGANLDAILQLAFADLDELAQASKLEDVPGFEAFEASYKGDSSIAIYDHALLTKNYKLLLEKAGKSEPERVRLLTNLINAHLHTIWQSQYPSGISITKPHPSHMTSLTSTAVHIAQLLASCPTNNPLPNTCPPTQPNCKPCTETSIPLTLSNGYANTTNTFHLTPIPHALTFTALLTSADPAKFTPRFIRRKTVRDEWLHATTALILPDEKLGAQQRLVACKDLVDSGGLLTHGLALTAERDDPLDLDWLFGFAMPSLPEAVASAKLQAKLHASDIAASKAKAARDGKLSTPAQERAFDQALARLTPSEATLQRERSLIREAGAFVKAKGEKETRLRQMVEAWNLADLEAWRFVRAGNARRGKEVESYRREWGIDRRGE